MAQIVITTSKAAKRQAAHEQKLENIRRKKALDKEKQETKRKTQEEKTKRFQVWQEQSSRRKEAVMKKRASSAKTKTVARSSAAGSAAISENISETEQARSYERQKKYEADLEQAKLEQVIQGNVNGVNAVDPSKSGGNGNANPKDRSTDYYAGW